MAAMLGKVVGCQSVGNHTPMIGSGYDNFKKNGQFAEWFEEKKEKVTWSSGSSCCKLGGELILILYIYKIKILV